MEPHSAATACKPFRPKRTSLRARACRLGRRRPLAAQSRRVFTTAAFIGAIFPRSRIYATGFELTDSRAGKNAPQKGASHDEPSRAEPEPVGNCDARALGVGAARCTGAARARGRPEKCARRVLYGRDGRIGWLVTCPCV